MADVVALPVIRVDNGSDGVAAREAVGRYFDEFPDPPAGGALHREDHFLLRLWAEGFIIIPITEISDKS